MMSRSRLVLERLAKWRSVLAAWQLGTRLSTDPECQAVRDHRELTIMLRAETNALTGLLIRKGVFTIEELDDQLAEEAEGLDEAYRRRFPGIHATDDGIAYSLPEAAETMRGWKP